MDPLKIIARQFARRDEMDVVSRACLVAFAQSLDEALDLPLPRVREIVRMLHDHLNTAMPAEAQLIRLFERRLEARIRAARIERVRNTANILRNPAAGMFRLEQRAHLHA